MIFYHDLLQCIGFRTCVLVIFTRTNYSVLFSGHVFSLSMLREDRNTETETIGVSHCVQNNEMLIERKESSDGGLSVELR